MTYGIYSEVRNGNLVFVITVDGKEETSTLTRREAEKRLKRIIARHKGE